MKIKDISLNNFANYASVSVSFDENVTYLVGKNGGGKSTLGITGVQFIFEGISEKVAKGTSPIIGERFRFIGPNGVTGKGEMTLYDEKTGWEVKVLRKLTKTGTELKFQGPDTANLNQQWLTDLFNLFLIAPKRFTELSPKGQALAIGIDTSGIDAEIKELKTEYTNINRDYRNLGEITPVDYAEKVDFADLSKQKDEIIEFNTEQGKKQEAIIAAKDQIASLVTEADDIVAEIIRLKAKLLIVRDNIVSIEAALAELPIPEPLKPLDDINLQIQNASDTNDKAVAYQKYIEDKKKKDDTKAKLDANTNKQKAKEQDRIDYIKSLKLPFDNLSIDEEGQLLMDGKLIKEPFFSTGELLKTIPVLISSQNPKLKYVFIQDANLLDEDNLKEIESYLTGKGYQLVFEMVGKAKIKDKTTILLKDNKVVDDYEETKNILK